MWLLPLQGALSPPCPALGILWLSTHPSLSCAPRHSPRLTARLLACHQNCLREIRSSLEQSKPLVLVQEADPDKGGATLQALRGECPEDLQPAIFDNDWPLTIWYRIDEFQLISLKIIAEAPPATTSSVLSLYLPANPT